MIFGWGDDWAAGPAGPPVQLVHGPCGQPMHHELTCPHCGGEVTAANTGSVPGLGSTARL